jgi:hypothetical protein
MLWNISVNLSSVTNLKNLSQGETWIYWNWTNPPPDFYQAILYLNGVNLINTTNHYYNFTSLTADSLYTLIINTNDVFGNINTTNVNSTVRTQATYISPSITSHQDCENKKLIIFSTFALIGLFAIALASLFIVNMFGQNFDSTAIITLVITMISIGLITMFGYYIVSQVAISTCL